jgi:plasmid stability protein
MAELSIRGLDEQVKARLRVRAARNGRSMEAEVRTILGQAVAEPIRLESLFTALLDRFASIGGVELDLPSREIVARAPDFSA